MVQQEKEHDVHVEYNVQEKDIDGKLTNGLNITTPLAMILITKRFGQSNFNRLTNKLRSEFGYTETEMIPLTISNSEYDFILITCDAIEERPLGYTWSDREGGKDGHELDVSNVAFTFVFGLDEPCCGSKLNVGMVYNGSCYGNDDFLKDLGENMTVTFEKTIYGITNIQILHRGIYFSFAAVDELCIPYDAELEES